MVGVPYPGMKQLGLWFLDCMSNSEYRGYHKRYLYEPQFQGKMDARKRALQEQKKKEWLAQQQLEREQIRQEYKKQQQMKQRELLQREQEKKRYQKRKKNNNLPVEATFTYSIPSLRKSDIKLESLSSRSRSRCGYYVRVHVSINSQSTDQIGSIDAMYFDCMSKIKKVDLIKRGKSQKRTFAPRYYGEFGGYGGFRRIPGPWEIVKPLRKALIDMFNTFGCQKDKTMSIEDFCKYLTHCYGISDSNYKKNKSISIKETAKRIINKYSKFSNGDALDWNGFVEYYRQCCINNPNDVWRDLNAFNYGPDLKKPINCKTQNDEQKQDNRANFLIEEEEEEKRMDIHYPDASKDGNIKINVKKETDGKYFADFSVRDLKSRLGRDFCNVRPRIIGKRIGGKQFECKGLTPLQQCRREKYSKRQDLQLETQLQQWKKGRLLEMIATATTTTMPPVTRPLRSKYELGVKTPINAQIMTSGFGSEQVPVVIQFSISTVKWNKLISHNVKYIALDCSTVRVLIRIVSGNVKSFDSVYFDGVITEEKASKNNWKASKKKKRNGQSWISLNGFRFVSFPECEKSDANIVVSGPIDKDGSVYYCDIAAKSLFNQFGDKLGNGISPRVKGVTFEGNKFYCSGGDEYRIRGKSRQDVVEEEKQAQAQEQQKQEKQEKIGSKPLSHNPTPSQTKKELQKPPKPQAQVEQETQHQAAQQLAQKHEEKEQGQEQTQGSQQSPKVEETKQNEGTSQTAPHRAAQRDVEKEANEQQIVERQTAAISVQAAPQLVQKLNVQHEQHEQHQQHHSQQPVSQMQQQIHHPTQVVPVQAVQYIPMYTISQAPMQLQMATQMTMQAPMVVQLQVPQQGFGTGFQVLQLHQPFGFATNNCCQQVMTSTPTAIPLSRPVSQASEKVIPQAMPHGMHNGAKPKRPPITMRSK